MFRDRREAGRALAGLLRRHEGSDAVILAIPKGGIPVGYEVAKALGCPLDIVLVRKLPVPWEPEAGFGAITEDGAIFLNDPLVSQSGLSPGEIESVAATVRAEVSRRADALRGNRPPLSLADRTVFLVDDGLASGYTMLAALASERVRRARRAVVAVPCGSGVAIRRVQGQADDLYVIVRSDEVPFAVASFYESFPEVPDAVARELLASA